MWVRDIVCSHKIVYTHYAVLFESRLRDFPERPVLILPAVDVGLDDVRNDLLDDMLPDVDLPPQAPHRVVHDRLAEMAPRLERVPPLRARRADARARALRDRVRVVVHVHDGRRAVVGPCGARAVRGQRRQREVQAPRGEALARGLERDRGQPEGRAEQGGERAAERVPGEPDVCVGVEGGEVVDQALGEMSGSGSASGLEEDAPRLRCRRGCPGRGRR